jgi:hypothetical protein
VFPVVIVGMIEPSAMRRFFTPWIRSLESTTEYQAHLCRAGHMVHGQSAVSLGRNRSECRLEAVGEAGDAIVVAYFAVVSVIVVSRPKKSLSWTLRQRRVCSAVS